MILIPIIILILYRVFIYDNSVRGINIAALVMSACLLAYGIIIGNSVTNWVYQLNGYPVTFTIIVSIIMYPLIFLLIRQGLREGEL